MKRFLVFILSFFIGAQGMLAESRLLDRLVLEVSGKSYTQRQVEVYFMIRNLALGKPPQNGLLTPDSWQGGLEIFEQDTIVYDSIQNENQRSETLPVEQKSRSKIQFEIEKIQEENHKIRSFMKNFRVTESELGQNINMFLKVQDFIKMRKQMVTAHSEENQAWVTMDPKSEWFLALRRSAPSRLYDEAREYKSLHERRQ